MACQSTQGDEEFDADHVYPYYEMAVAEVARVPNEISLYCIKCMSLSAGDINYK
jgi:hypothetical protein